MWLLSVVEMGSDQLSRQDMSVTFSNETFNNSDAAVGAIAAVNVLGLMVDEFAGSPLTGTVGLTTVTVNGTAGAPGSPASISINSPLVQIANGAATYAGFYNNAGDIVYYFNVVGTNIVTGLAATVAVAVSAEALPSLLTATPINTSATTAPLDPNLPGPVFQSASVTGNTVTLGYNEALSSTGPLATAFTVSSGGVADIVTSATVSGQNVVLTLATPVANGQTVTVGYTDPTTGNDIRAIQDVNGLDAASLPVTTITNNTPQGPGPVFQTATVNGSTLTLAYNEALSPIGPGAGSYAVTVAGTPVLVLATAVSGQNIILTLATPVANGQAVTVGYTDPSTGNDIFAAQDTAGNDAATLTPVMAANTTPQAPGPVLQTATADGSTVTLAYNEALSPVAPAAGSFAVTVDGAAANVTTATVSGQSVVLTLAIPVANGQAVTVGYRDPTTGNDANAVQDLVGNDAATTLTPIAATNITAQALGPLLQTASVNGSTLTLTYTEALSTTGPGAGSFAVTVNGVAAPVTSSMVSGQTVVLTLATPVANGQGVTVSYTDPTGGNDVNAVQDTVGNDAPSVLLAIATNNTPQAPGPVLQTATVNGNTVTLAYNETLSPIGPGAGSYAVTVAGTPVLVLATAVSGQTVVLTLATPVANGQAVTVGYTDPSAGNDIFAAQDTVGNDAATTLIPIAATNVTPQGPGPVLQTATVAGSTLTLTYNETLSPVGPAAASFAVTVGGATANVTAATVSGQTVVLTLATPVANGQLVTVGYTDPSSFNDLFAVQDLVGNDAATLTPIAAVNTTAQAPGPVLQTATVNGSTVTLAYNEALSPVGPGTDAFTVTVNGALANVSSSTVSGQTVVLTLAAPVANGQAVTVGYRDPTAGNDVNAVQDTVGNDAATTLTPITATNITAQAPGPIFQTATVNGNTLTLAYDETLSGAGPAASSFAVTVGGTAAAVSGATVSGQTVILTLATPVANGQAVTVGYTDPSAGNDVNAVQDAVGNDAATLTPVVAANTTPQAPGPVFQTATVDGNTLTLAYDETLSGTGPAAGSFTVMVNGALANVTAAAVSGQSVVLTLATPVANGQAVTVGYTDPSADNDVNAVQDTVGNDAATFTPVAAVNSTPQAPGPVLQTATVNSSTLTLAYNEALSAIGPNPDAFAVTVSGAAATVTAAIVSGQTVVLTLGTPVTNGQTVTVGYMDPTAGNDVVAVQDTVGNDAATTLTPIAAINTTQLVPGPVFQTATVNGSTLTLAYDEALSATGPNLDAFAVTVGSAAATVTNARVSGQTVILTLATPVANGQAVTVGYNDPTTGDDVDAIQDAVGNDAATLSPVSVANTTPQAPGPALLTASVIGNTLTLAYDEALSAVGPNAGSFAVTVDGAAVNATAATVSDHTVLLTLATPVANGQAVTVGYTDPSTGNDVNAVQDLVGNDAASTLTPHRGHQHHPAGPGPGLPDRHRRRQHRHAGL